MKHYVSFLFCYLILPVFILLYSQNSFAQKSRDSLQYYVKLVKHPQSANDFTNAYQYLVKSKEKSLIEKDSLRAAYCLYHIASLEYKTGFYIDSEVSLTEALKLLDRMSYSNYSFAYRMGIYNLLGILYREQNNDAIAFDLFNRAFQLAQSAKDSVTLYNNKSNIYKDLNQYESAKKELLKALTIVPRVSDTLAKARVLDNLGFAYSKLNQEEALPLMQDALELRQLVDDSESLYISYIHLSKHYKERLNLVLAKEYAMKAYDIATKLNSISFKNDALANLIAFNSDEFVSAYKTINDSLTLTNKRSDNRFAMMKYNTSEKERLLKESQLNNEIQLRQTQLYQAIGAVVILLGIFLFFLFRMKHKKEKLQEVYRTESRISKKVHDEVANDIYHVMTKLQSDINNNEDVLDHLENIYIKTRDISKESATVHVDENFNDLIKDLLMSYKTAELNVIAKNASKIDWNGVSDLSKTTIYRVLQELLTNMRKHSEATIVVVGFEKSKNRIEINYKDNGVGCNLFKSNGLQNTESRMASINGSIRFESQINNGFKAIMSI
ncbi:hypothetical protein A9Q87_13455 [Flavobacteriales bacterium 34_180_T64]|nr:hypothetical protein A9Q87_13455 [Flavobacteriales bacterium 34_180_T64]